jgi:hypothetical protein
MRARLEVDSSRATAHQKQPKPAPAIAQPKATSTQPVLCVRLSPWHLGRTVPAQPSLYMDAAKGQAEALTKGKQFLNRGRL